MGYFYSGFFRLFGYLELLVIRVVMGEYLRQLLLLQNVTVQLFEDVVVRVVVLVSLRVVGEGGYFHAHQRELPLTNRS